jgi:hypothetical protein
MIHLEGYENYQVNEAKENKSWVVTCYSKRNNIIKQWTIEDRTEHEAEKEAEPNIPNDCYDWSLMPKKFWDNIKKSEKREKNDK